MRLKIPPALVFIIFSGLMYLLAKYLPIGSFAFFGNSFLIIALITLGLLIGVFALFQFVYVKTTINPQKPFNTEKLITNGLYSYTRNPMYLAMLVLLISLALYLRNAFNIFLITGFVSYMNLNQIIPEEKALGQIFGTSYKMYCKQVRRWF